MGIGCRVSEASLRERLGRGESYAAIARETGGVAESVRQRAIRLEQATRRRHGRVPGVAALRAAVLLDAPLSAAATAWGCAPASILRACRRAGLPTDPVGRAAFRREARS